jgi:pseudaminic acid synthase
MTATVTIAGRAIGADHPPYVIAEMSGNHNGDIGRACALIAAAKAAGADAVKLQTYTADTITMNHDGPGFVVEGGLWQGQRLYDLYQQAHTPWDWHDRLFAEGKRLGITVFSSPFDATAVDLLEGLDAPAYKIASFELVDLPLIARVARTGKPVIMSTGMSETAEIEEAVACARAAGATEILLLHCVSGYPTPAGEANLKTIPDLAARFAVPVGLSDHSMGLAVPVAAIAMGAVAIEKHFTLRRADGGPDSAFSLESDELAELCSQIRTAWDALGAVRHGCTASEIPSRVYRRSLYVVEDIRAGEAFTAANLRSIRPAYGLAPKHLPEILGRPAACDLARGTPLAWKHVVT